jgi:hypothetical protein
VKGSSLQKSGVWLFRDEWLGEILASVQRWVPESQLIPFSSSRGCIYWVTT